MRNSDRRYDDSVHADLRSSYERGRRDARRERRSSPMLLMAAAGTVILGAAMVALTLIGEPLPGREAPANHSAVQISSDEPGEVMTVGEGDWKLH